MAINAESDTISIYVTLVVSEERTIQLNIPKNILVRDLKIEIQNQFNTPVESQRLIYMGRILDNNSLSIASYHIIDGCTIQMTIIPHQTASQNLELPSARQRRLLESRMQSAGTLSLDGQYMMWRQFLLLSGSRLSMGGDVMTYPRGAELEHLRQGILTYDTLVSALNLPAEESPGMVGVDLGAEGSIRMTGYRRFFVGEWVDALDTVQHWLEATVIATATEFVYVHYNGWENRWDEWIHVNSSRLAPFRTRTKHTQMESVASPRVVTWAHSARPTGTEDVDTLLCTVRRACMETWSAVERASTRREGESAAAFTKRRSVALRELSPLLDRVGRLTTDAASITQFVGNGGIVESVPIITADVGRLPTVPASPSSPGDPHVGMEALIRSGLEEEEEEPIQTVVIPLNIPTGVSANTSDSELGMAMLNQLLTSLHGQSRLTGGAIVQSPRAADQPVMNDSISAVEGSHVLSDSVSPSASALASEQRPSLMSRLRSLGLVAQSKEEEETTNHDNEVIGYSRPN